MTAVYNTLLSGVQYMTDSVKDLIRGGKMTKVGQKNGMDLYKLALKESHKDSKTKLRRCVLGKLKHHEEEKTIMVIGATGSGKSTMIEGICNYMFGTEWEAKHRLVMIDETKEEQENKEKGEAMSQTEYITVYTVPRGTVDRVPYTLNIIDTPGFGDVKGIERDKEIVEQIRVLFENRQACAIDTIHAVCFLVQAPLARLTQTQKYIFDAILSMFGKDIEKNILIMTTFADGAKPPVLAALKAAQVPYNKAFKFNNSALFASNSDDDDGMDQDSDEESDSFSKNFWSMGMKSFQNFFKHLATMDGISLTLTKEVLKKRYTLQETLKPLSKMVQLGLATMAKLKDETKIFKRHEAAIKDNKDFTYKVEEEYQVCVPCEATHYVTNCLICESPCHDPCRIPNNADKDGCWAMTDDYCRICEKKCHWTKHQNTGLSIQIRRREVAKTHFQMKAAYEKAQGKHITGMEIIKCLQEDYEKAQKEVNNLVRRCNKILDRLNEIALQPDPLSDVGYIDMLIQLEQKLGKEGWQKRVDELYVVRKQAQCMKDIREGKDVLNEGSFVN